MEELFKKNETLNTEVKRNIASLRKSEDLFDDLYDKDDGKKEIAQAVEFRVKQNMPTDLLSRGYYYTMSILFPFESENYQRTRYSDGSFGCWYGSLELDTSIYETAYHNLQNEIGISDLQEVIYRERAVYDVKCEGILVDLRGHQKKYPQLISDDYSLTHPIGHRLSKQGHPGLLAPSARKLGGTNLAVFNPSILSNPRVFCYLNYYIDPIKKIVTVERTGNACYKQIDFN